LSVKQLRELSTRLGQPIRSSATSEEIRTELIRNVQAEEYWRTISSKGKPRGMSEG
jgi:hypothetical protein